MSGTVRKIPLRKCTGCNEMIPKKEMIRVILDPEGNIDLDDTGKRNGRGAYICKKRECFRKAVKSKGLEKSLKCSIPEEIYRNLEENYEWE
ncbi:MAG: YlxR family protein [Lachnospiraceae bacterium]|nr:YlxR family protein [Lachnospiraceae bacterium]